MNFYDLALVYDPVTRRADLALGPDGDLVIDETAATPMILSIGLDRRAEDDDELPQGRTKFLTPATFSERRGAIGDALDPNGDLTGSRLWLLDRAKQTEATRLMFEFWLNEALAWVEDEGGELTVEVNWVRRNFLGWRAGVEDASIEQTLELA